jgi:predicted HTH domain antitoxin
MTEKRASIIFNEWVRRYAKDPEEFSKILDENGKPYKDYGDMAAAYFMFLDRELK